MSAMTIGTLAQSLATQSAHLRLQTDLGRLSVELATGLTGDVAAKTVGDTRVLTALAHHLSDLDAFATSRSEAALHTRATGNALSSIAGRLSQLAEQVVVASQAADPSQHAIVTEGAIAQFKGVVSDLNTRIAGRSLFSGTAQDRDPLRAADDIIADLQTAASGVSSAADIEAALDAYFAPGGPFDTNDYIGSTDDLAPVRVDAENTVSVGIRGDNSDLRQTLATLAGLALVGLMPLDPIESQRAIAGSLDAILNSERQLTEVQAQIGSAAERIELATVRSAGTRAAFEAAQLDITGSDPFETAARLEERQVQLQTLYTLTARLSGLSLVNFLR